jgi:predicted chitinase
MQLPLAILVTITSLCLVQASSTKAQRGHSFSFNGKVFSTDVLPPHKPAVTWYTQYRQNPESIANVGHMIPSKNEFVKAFTSNHYDPPSDRQYRGFVKGIDTNTFSSKREVAMFLAHALHESGGLKVLIEERCLKDNCRHDYRLKKDPADKFYFGRGYLQLTWSYNYKNASVALLGDPNVLLKHPERVAEEEELAWGAAFWFWRAHMHKDSRIQRGMFGYSTLKLNGDQECGRNANWLSERRFKLYTNVLLAFRMDEKPDPSGCY